MTFNRRTLLKSSALAGLATLCSSASFAKPARKPNFIIILCDDLGYGDIGAMGGKTIRTPNIDRMAREGTVLTDYYAPANLCTPSRAGMLTGRLRSSHRSFIVRPASRSTRLPANVIASRCMLTILTPP
jgi:hypothetical protein